MMLMQKKQYDMSQHLVLCIPTVKAYTLLTVHLNTGSPLSSESELFTGDTPNYIISPGVQIGEKIVPRTHK